MANLIQDAVLKASDRTTNKEENQKYREKLRETVGSREARTTPTNAENFQQGLKKNYGYTDRELKELAKNIKRVDYGNSQSNYHIRELQNVYAKMGQDNFNCNILHGAFPNFKKNPNTQANNMAIDELTDNLINSIKQDPNKVLLIALPDAFYNGLQENEKKYYDEAILNALRVKAQQSEVDLSRIVVFGGQQDINYNGFTRASGKDMLSVANNLSKNGCNPCILDNAHTPFRYGNGALGNYAENALEEHIFRRIPVAYLLEDRIKESFKALNNPNLNSSRLSNAFTSNTRNTENKLDTEKFSNIIKKGRDAKEFAQNLATHYNYTNEDLKKLQNVEYKKFGGGIIDKMRGYGSAKVEELKIRDNKLNFNLLHGGFPIEENRDNDKYINKFASNLIKSIKDDNRKQLLISLPNGLYKKPNFSQEEIKNTNNAILSSLKKQVKANGIDPSRIIVFGGQQNLNYQGLKKGEGDILSTAKTISNLNDIPCVLDNKFHKNNDVFNVQSGNKTLMGNIFKSSPASLLVDEKLRKEFKKLNFDKIITQPKTSNLPSQHNTSNPPSQQFSFNKKNKISSSITNDIDKAIDKSSNIGTRGNNNISKLRKMLNNDNKIPNNATEFAKNLIRLYGYTPQDLEALRNVRVDIDNDIKIIKIEDVKELHQLRVLNANFPIQRNQGRDYNKSEIDKFASNLIDTIKDESNKVLLLSMPNALYGSMQNDNTKDFYNKCILKSLEKHAEDKGIDFNRIVIFNDKNCPNHKFSKAEGKDIISVAKKLDEKGFAPHIMNSKGLDGYINVPRVGQQPNLETSIYAEIPLTLLLNDKLRADFKNLNFDHPSWKNLPTIPTAPSR